LITEKKRKDKTVKRDKGRVSKVKKQSGGMGGFLKEKGSNSGEGGKKSKQKKLKEKTVE